MADEFEPEKSREESPSGGENPPESKEPGIREGITELQNLVVQKETAMTEINARLIELEQAIRGKDEEIAILKRGGQEMEERVATLNNSLSEAVASYTKVVVQANPEVIDELIGGDTIESINESMERAKDLVSKVRQGVETEISLTRVPAGAPERTSPDLSALSPREKIQYAIGKIR